MKIKNKGITVTGLMRQSAKYNASRISIAAGDRKLTYAEGWNRGVRLANGFLSMGLSPGDRVAVLEDNSIEAQDFFFGVRNRGTC